MLRDHLRNWGLIHAYILTILTLVVILWPK